MDSKLTVFIKQRLSFRGQMRELRAQTDEWMKEWRASTAGKVHIDDKPGVIFKLIDFGVKGGFIRLVYGAFVLRKEE